MIKRKIDWIFYLTQQCISKLLINYIEIYFYNQKLIHVPSILSFILPKIISSLFSTFYNFLPTRCKIYTNNAKWLYRKIIKELCHASDKVNLCVEITSHFGVYRKREQRFLKTESSKWVSYRDWYVTSQVTIHFPRLVQIKLNKIAKFYTNGSRKIISQFVS